MAFAHASIDDECTDEARPYCVPNAETAPNGLRGRCVVCDIETAAAAVMSKTPRTESDLR